MAKKTRKQQKPIDEIVSFFDRVLPKSQEASRDRFLMPGIDAYSPRQFF